MNRETHCSYVEDGTDGQQVGRTVTDEIQVRLDYHTSGSQHDIHVVTRVYTLT